MKEERNKIKERKKREQELKVYEILKAARSIFFKKGFLKTTMDEIAYEAALSKPTIYKFYPTKEDLYFSLVIPVLQDCRQEMEDINLHLQLNMFSSGETLIRMMMNVFVQKYLEYPDSFRIGQLFQQAAMLWNLDKNTDSSIREISRRITDEMRSIFDTAVTQGLVKDINRRVLVEILLGSFFGIIQLHDAKQKYSGDDEKLQAVVATAIDLFTASIVLK